MEERERTTKAPDDAPEPLFFSYDPLSDILILKKGYEQIKLNSQERELIKLLSNNLQVKKS